MDLLICLLFAVVGIWYFRPKKRSKRPHSKPVAVHRTVDPEQPWQIRQYIPDDLDDTPDSERFATWEEAYNRPIGDDLLFEIEYADLNGVVTEREITPLSIHLITRSPAVYIRAFCHLRNAERNFRSDRILSARNLQTNRPIKDLGSYLRGKY